MNDAEKMKEIEAYSRLTQVALATKIGVSNGMLTHVKNGSRPISVKLANKIAAAFPEIRYEWVTRDSGNMLRGRPADDIGVHEPMEIYGSSPNMAAKAIEALEQLKDSLIAERDRLKAENEALKQKLQANEQ